MPRERIRLRETLDEDEASVGGKGSENTERDARGLFRKGNKMAAVRTTVRSSVQERRRTFDAFLTERPNNLSVDRYRYLLELAYGLAEGKDMRAIRYLLDQGMGRAHQHLTLSGDSDSPITVDLNRYL